MRIYLFLFLFSLSNQHLHAENATDFTDALSELRSTMAKHPVQHEDEISFKKTTDNADCVFPDSPEYIAPGWVCDETVMGVEISAVGSSSYIAPVDGIKVLSNRQGTYTNTIDPPLRAYIDALLQYEQTMDVYTRNLIKQYVETTGTIYKSENNDFENNNGGVEKFITQISSRSGNLKISRMIKTYTGQDDLNKAADNINISVMKLVYNSENCQLLIKQYISDNNAKPEYDEKTVSRGACDFYQVVQEMNQSNIELFKIIKSPNDIYYVLVGTNEHNAAAMVDSINNDRALWEQFKKTKK